MGVPCKWKGSLMLMTNAAWGTPNSTALETDEDPNQGHRHLTPRAGRLKGWS